MKNNLQKAILETAKELIIQKGVKKTSLNDIAKQMKISKGTLYYHYKTKDEIILGITKLHIREVSQDIFSYLHEHKGALNEKDMLLIVFNTLIASKTRNRLHLYLVNDAIEGNETLKEQFIETYCEWKKLLKEGLGQVFSIKEEMLDTLVEMILAIVDGLSMQEMIGIEDARIEAVCDFLLNVT